MHARESAHISRARTNGHVCTVRPNLQVIRKVGRPRFMVQVTANTQAATRRTLV